MKGWRVADVSILGGTAIAAVIAALLWIPLVGYSSVFQVSEAREGVVIHEILSSGNYILPLRNGEIVPSKPPLFHWIAVGFSHLFDFSNESILRLPSALAAVGAIALQFFLASSLAGIASGAFAAAILASSYGFSRLALDGRVDMLFSFLTTAAIACWILGAALQLRQRKSITEIPARWYWGVGMFSGLSMLAKGPLGLVLPLLVIAAIAFRSASLAGVRSICRPGWLIAPALALPWYIAAAMLGSDAFVERQLWFENVVRFFGGKGIAARPVWFYVVHFWSQLAPWCLVYIVLLVWGVRRSRSQRKAQTPRQFGIQASFIWFVVMFVFFTIAFGKRRAYLLPTLPAMALGLGLVLPVYCKRALSLLLRKPNGLQKLQQIRVGGVFLLALTIAFLVGFYAFCAMPWLYQHLGSSEMRLTFKALPGAIRSLWPVIIGQLALLSIICLGSWWASAKGKRVWSFATAVVSYSLIILLVCVNTGLALKAQTHKYETFAHRVTKLVPEEQELRFIKKYYDESFDGFFFYYPRHVVMHPPAERSIEPGLYLSRESWLVAQPDGFISRVNIIERGGRQVDEAYEQLVLFRFKELPKWSQLRGEELPSHSNLE